MKEPISSISTPSGQRILIRAGAIMDGCAHAHIPGCLLVRCSKRPGGIELIVEAVAAHIEPGSDMHIVDMPGDLLMPALVNAHCHLDLTSVGPQPRPSQFHDWLATVRSLRPQEPAQIRASVQQGIELSLAGGVVAVGDIAGSTRTGPSLVPWRTLRDSPLEGVSFLEFFSIGKGSQQRLDGLERVLEEAGCDRSMLGLQPHAPYSVNLAGYARAIELARRYKLPLATHLAESIEERSFIVRGTGPQRVLLQTLGLWDYQELTHIGLGKHPIVHLSGALAQARWLIAHANDCPDEALDPLAETGARVVYCPRAHDYFGLERTLGAHRYRDMLEWGICVCLGTDSIVNLPPESARAPGGRISVFDEARVLYRRDRTDPTLLVRMMTTNGAEALGLERSRYTFAPGCAIAGVVAVRTESDNPIRSAFEGDSPPRLVLGPSVRDASSASSALNSLGRGDPEADSGSTYSAF